MKELDAQGMICKSVRVHGGFARKMSHRFLIGVPDLLVKLPDWDAMFLEAKWRDEPVQDDHRFKLKVTAQQFRFLKEAQGAGLGSGIVSVLTFKKPGRGSRLKMGLYSLAAMEATDFTVDARSHTVIHSRIDDPARLIASFQAAGGHL